MNYLTEIIVALISGVCVAVVTQVGQYIRERRSRKDAKADNRSANDRWQEDAILTLLHDRLYAECTAAIRRQSIDVDGLRNVEALYKVYHAKGGNGTGTSLYKRATALPIEGGN